jgi:hypothetical protein
MKRTRRIILSVTLLFAGLTLLAYGAAFHPSTVLPEKQDTPPITKSEPQLVKEASIGGLKLDAFGNIRLTYTGTPPKDCAT